MYTAAKRIHWLFCRLIPSTSRTRFVSIKTFEEIPGPRLLPVVGSLLDLLSYKGGISKGRVYLPLERVKTFGKIYREKFGAARPTVCLADPEDVEVVLRNESSYPKRFDMALFEYFWKLHNRESGVFFLNGVDWYKHRSVLSKRMLVPKSIAQYTPELNRISSEFATRVKTLRVLEGAENSYEVENINDELFKWSFESVAFVLFDKRFESMGDKVDPNIQEFIMAISGFLEAVALASYLPPKFYDYYQTKSYKKFASCYEKMYHYAQLFIFQRLKELEQNEIPPVDNDQEVSLFQYLLFNKKFSQKDLLSSIIDLLFAGVDTTSNTMQWIIYELAKNPVKQALLFDEITAVFHTDPDLSFKGFQNLPYLKAVVKETLRLHPVLIEISRLLHQDIIISGYNVPAGTQVNIMSYAMGQDADLFDEPSQFLPERWLKSNENNTFHKFSSIPFGFGRRMCIGRRLAELEMHLLLIHLMQNFHLEYPENEIMAPFARGTLIPEKPVRVKFIDRKKL